MNPNASGEVYADTIASAEDRAWEMIKKFSFMKS